MSKSSKRPPAKARQSARLASAETARADVAAGRFREAIATYKDLLKQDPGDTRGEGLRDGLASAYAGRARQLVAKGMLKEALVMWENRAALGAVPWQIDQTALMLRLGRIDAVLSMLESPPLDADPAAQGALIGLLAAHALGGTPGILERLAPDDPIRVQYPAAMAALEAYQAGDEPALGQALKTIPFRSPYRDLVTILKTLGQLVPGDWSDATRDAAGALLARVGNDSGFAPLRDAVRLALLDPRALASSLREAAPATRELVFALRGWSAERIALWNELHALGTTPSERDLLRLLFRHRRALGETWVRERGLRMLLPHPHETARWWTEAGGRALNRLERARLDAWASEIEGEPWTVAGAWRDYAELLRKEAGQRVAPGSDLALMIALARRRAESVFRVLERHTPDTDPDSLQSELVADLEASLLHDPEDRATHLSLIAYHLRAKDLKQARQVLKRAQTRWPSDKAVLTAAMDTAIASGAYKKAASLATEILAVDPINSAVRERLVDAHLAHARKNLADRRPDLAERALDLAAEWARGEHARERLDLVRGMVALRAGRETDGEQLLRALSERLGAGLSARLLIALEAHGCGMPFRPLLQRLALAQPSTPDLADLRTLFTRLRGLLDGGVKLPFEVGRDLDASLQRAAKMPLERAELEFICETLRRARLDDTRRAFADAALKRWRGEPIFVLHAFESRYRDVEPWKVPLNEKIRLEQALERAREQGAMRLVHRLIELMNDPMPRFGMPSPFGPFGGGFGLDDDDEDEDEDEGFGGDPIELFADMIRTLGPARFRMLLKAPGPLGEAMRNLQSEIGKVEFERLIQIISAGIDEDDGPNALFPFLDEGPSPSKRARARAKRKRR